MTTTKFPLRLATAGELQTWAFPSATSISLPSFPKRGHRLAWPLTSRTRWSAIRPPFSTRIPSFPAHSPSNRPDHMPAVAIQTAASISCVEVFTSPPSAASPGRKGLPPLAKPFYRPMPRLEAALAAGRSRRWPVFPAGPCCSLLFDSERAPASEGRAQASQEKWREQPARHSAVLSLEFDSGIARDHGSKAPGSSRSGRFFSVGFTGRIRTGARTMSPTIRVQHELRYRQRKPAIDQARWR